MSSPQVRQFAVSSVALLVSIVSTAFVSVAGCIGVSAKPVPPNGVGTVAVQHCRATKAALDGPFDDFEDGNNQITVMGGRDGYWFNAKDDHGSTIEMSFDEPGAGGSAMALHVKGTTAPGNPADGIWGAQVGTHFSNTSVLYDASKYAGIGFRAKVGPGSGRAVRFKIGDVNTHPDANVCKTCWNHFGQNLSLTPNWKEYKITFASAVQEPDWGNPRPAALSPDKLVSIDWTIAPGQNYDIWIDDIVLLECAD